PRVALQLLVRDEHRLSETLHAVRRGDLGPDLPSELPRLRGDAEPPSWPSPRPLSDDLRGSLRGRSDPRLRRDGLRDRERRRMRDGDPATLPCVESGAQDARDDTAAGQRSVVRGRRTVLAAVRRVPETDADELAARRT